MEEETILIVNEESEEAVEAETVPKAAFPVAHPDRKSDYTVQLVTYTTEALAIREVNRLKSSGYEGFVIPSGTYYQVCADYFASKLKARSVLERFRASGRYPGAYIRPVVR